MVFKRPELEKDNPIASQPYVGPRRRRAGAHGVMEEVSGDVGEMKEAFQALTDAASRFMKGLHKTKATAKDMSALRKAIVHAERLLSAQGQSN